MAQFNRLLLMMVNQIRESSLGNSDLNSSLTILSINHIF